MLRINDIISRHYDELLKCCCNDKVISQSQTEEDFLNNVCITAINKYKDRLIDEDEGLNYLKKNLFMEKKAQYKRLVNEKITYTDNLTAYERVED